MSTTSPSAKYAPRHLHPTWETTQMPPCGHRDFDVRHCAGCRPENCCPTDNRPTWPPGSTSSASPAWPPSRLSSSQASSSPWEGLTGGIPTRWATSATASTCGVSKRFMAFLVIHLWGKFWMAAWRGKRSLTWVTGVVAFVASVVECFTGYLSQQNFDSQWISTSGKDAFNAVGVGSFFNLMNFGQMLMWHIVLIPLVLVALVGAHILAVRVRGVVHPLPVQRTKGRTARRAAATADAAEWRGPTRRYDILKEATIATVIAATLVVALSALLSSPDDPPVTIATWAKVAPADFVATAASELAGTSETATYGPPYNSQNGSTQRILFSPEDIIGVRQPIDTAQTFVLSPLGKIAPTNAALTRELDRYRDASAATRASWNAAYAKAVTKATVHGGTVVVPRAADGPIPGLIATELSLARSGALDTDLISDRDFYGSDFTKPLLFLEDGQYSPTLPPPIISLAPSGES